MTRPVLAVAAALFLTQEAAAFHHQPSVSTAGGVRTASTQLFGVRSVARRVRDSVLSRERSREDLKIGIAGFYDRSSELWLDVWGEHMHHGVSVSTSSNYYSCSDGFMARNSRIEKLQTAHTHFALSCAFLSP